MVQLPMCCDVYTIFICACAIAGIRQSQVLQNIINFIIMNSMQNANLSEANIAKAKATALKYEKFKLKQGTEKTKSQTRSLHTCIQKIDSVLTRVWKTVMPKWLRGPSTPYQHLLMSISQISMKIQIQHLPFSELTINQAVLQSRVKLIITYTENSLGATLEKINQSQQINALINKKAQILPVKIRERPNGQVCLALKDLIDNLANNPGYQDQVFVIWKGLFQEILVIAHFELGNPNLCSNIMTVIQQRQDYEEFVRKLAKGGEDLYDESSLSKLDEQISSIEKEEKN